MDVFAASPDSRPIEARHEALYRRARNEIPMGRPHARSEQRGGCKGWRMEEGWGLKRKYEGGFSESLNTFVSLKPLGAEQATNPHMKA